MELGYGRNIPFSKGLEQEAALHGRFPKLKVWVLGRGAEDLEVCLKAFRGRPGTLYLAGTLHILGDTQAEFIATYKRLKAAGIVIHDIISNERSDTDGVEMQRRAAAGLQYAKAMGGDRKTARRRGARGGKGKAVSAAMKREGVADEGVIRRLCECKLIPWKEKERILGISIGTLRRHYMKKH